ncbi:MAG: VCBS repeat-containing protein [Phycisphaerales bacterium]|nr:VCBS repeat-containing protein [Phycisphaerales bacterium]
MTKYPSCLLLAVVTSVASSQSCDPAMLFAPEARTQLVGEPYDITSGDLDHDGDPDLVIACNTTGSRFFEVMLNNGDGSFAAPVQYTLADQAWCVALADMNGDNHLDAVIGHGSTPEISVALGDGSGGFGAATQFGAGGFATITDLVLGDWNADSNIDVAMVTFANQIRTMLGDGAGNLAPPSTLLTFGTTVSITTTDLNGDLDPDLILGDSSGNGIRVMLGASGDSFTLEPLTDVGFFVTNHELGDMDNDGDLDVVVSGSFPDTVMVVENTGSGVFAAGPSITVELVPDGVAVGDFDADGNTDAVVSLAFTDAVALIIGNGDNTLQPQLNSMVGVENLELVADDFDGNGSIDTACVSNATRTVSVLLNTCSAPCVADINNDGMLDFFDLSQFLSNMIDWNGDTVFDFFDISGFLQSFAAGCP